MTDEYNGGKAYTKFLKLFRQNLIEQRIQMDRQTEKLFRIKCIIKKCREKEEVLKFNIKIISNDPDNINYLSKNELEYLGNWEAEKFRQNI